MGEILKRRLKQARFESPAHEAMLHLLVAAGHVRQMVDEICEAHGITQAQYNALPILRGGHPDGYPRCDVASRLIERAPDVTRLIDRLERHGLAERARSTADRRAQMHGKTSVVTHDGQGVYRGLPASFTVIRYHSLVIERASLPAELAITAKSDDGEIMGVRHRELAGTAMPVEGVQFHPESILSEHGHAMLRNFLELGSAS